MLLSAGSHTESGMRPFCLSTSKAMLMHDGSSPAASLLCCGPLPSCMCLLPYPCRYQPASTLPPCLSLQCSPFPPPPSPSPPPPRCCDAAACRSMHALAASGAACAGQYSPRCMHSLHWAASPRPLSPRCLSAPPAFLPAFAVPGPRYPHPRPGRRLLSCQSSAGCAWVVSGHGTSS